MKKVEDVKNQTHLKNHPYNVEVRDVYKTTGSKTDMTKFKTLDMFFRLTSPIGSLQSAITNNLYGINHQNIKGIIPEDRDSQGLVFFTRPCLNLTAPNLRNNRKMYSLLTKNPKSVHSYVRNMLDPRIHQWGNWTEKKLIELRDDKDLAVDFQEYMKDRKSLMKISAVRNYIEDVPKCPFVDDRLGFMPLLTNTIKSLRGWPDPVLPTFTSKEGLKREQWGMADGTLEIYNSFDLDCTFRNIRDKPIVILFSTWLQYMADVYEGLMDPYLDFLIENEIDYNTRIYRLVLDESKTYVKMISACGAAFPMANGIGSFFDFDDEKKYNDANRDYNIRFQCFGAMYNDDILVKEFNEVSSIFNPDIRMLLRTGSCPRLVEIPQNLLYLFNNRGYPIIDLMTLQLKWYINKDSPTYKEVIKYYGGK